MQIRSLLVVIGLTLACCLGGRPAAAQTPGSLVGTPPFFGVPVGADGWTALNPQSDSLIVYVSASFGNDANAGTSPATPKRTLAAAYALLRDGMPDWMLLRAGDVWTEALPWWGKSGRSLQGPMVVASYGGGERPLLQTGVAPAFQTAAFAAVPRQHIVLADLHFLAHTNDGSGISAGVEVTNGVTDLLIENCLIERYPVNIAMQGIETRPSNIKIRRTVVADAISTSGRSTGMIFGHADDILVEECVLDHNGWSETVPGCGPTMFSHNLYINPDNTTGVVVRHSIVARGAASGIRSSGRLCEYNLLLQNPVAIVVGPDTQTVRYNVILDARDIDPADPRGLGIDGSIGQNVEISGNVLAHQRSGTGNTKGINIGGNYAGLLVHDNVVYDWVQAVNNQAPALALEGLPLGLVRVYNNQFQQPNGAIYQQINPVPFGMYAYSGNKYAAANNQPFIESVGWLSYAQWVLFSGETGSAMGALPYLDPNRTIETYMASLGGSPSLGAFMAEARRQSHANWRAAYTAQSVSQYIRAGFTLPVASGENCPADLNGDGIVSIADVITFMNFFAASNPRANCDLSTTTPILNANDFACFLNKLAQGCH